MNLTRPLAFLDVETTGTDPVADRIVQVGIATLDTIASTPRTYSKMVHPGRLIPAEASAVHGITDATVDGLSGFSKIAQDVIGQLAGCDIGGYNLRSLDLPILDEELRRCGLKLDLTGVRIIDAYGIFAKLYPRKLGDAVRLFCGREQHAAHNALSDAVDALDVFRGQLDKHPGLTGMSLDGLAAYSCPHDRAFADLAGKLYRDDDGDLRYAFGKARDVKVKDDLGFARWMLDKDFPANTRDVLRAEMDRLWADCKATETKREDGELPF